MFTTVVVALDLESDGDRALPVVRALADLGDVSVELLTVSSPFVTEEIDAFELTRRATANGWPAHAYTILHSNEVAEAIVEHVENRDDVLLVMATTAKRPLVGHVVGSVTEGVLRHTDRPVLLVGPHVPAEFEWRCPTPVICIDATDAAQDAVPTIAAWMRTFRSSDPWIAEVLPTAATDSTSTDALEGAHVHHFATLLRSEQITASWEVLHGGDPGFWLEEFAEHIAEPLFVTTSSRWTDGRLHWRSATRALVQRSTHPVLVVPARHHRGAPSRDDTIETPRRGWRPQAAASATSPVVTSGLPPQV